MCCILEIGMLIYGIIGLSTGKMQFGKDKFVYGAPARLVGLIFLLPLPLALVGGFIYGATHPEQFQDFGQPGRGGNNFNETQIMISVVEGGMVLLFLLIGLGIASANFEPKREDRWQPSPRTDDILGPRSGGHYLDDPQDRYGEPHDRYGDQGGRYDDLPPDPRYKP